MENNKNLIVIKFKDIKLNKDLGEFFPSGKENSSLLNELNTLISYVILKEENKYLPKGSEICTSLKNHKIQWKLNQKTSTLILIVSNNNIDSKNIDGLLDEIESQNITKYLDKQGKINNVAKQNLQYIVDKHIDSKFNLSGSESDNTTSNTSRLDSINQDLDSIKKGMKSNIQNLVSNIEDSKVMDERASKIKDSSFMFKKSSSELHKMSKMRRLRNILIISGIVLVILLFFYFVLF